jgi:fluoroquinolone transport system permease protein
MTSPVPALRSRSLSRSARFTALVRNDMRLLWRHGFFAAYGFVAVVYLLLLRALPPDIAARLLGPLLFTEAGVVGFMFAGTLLQLERQDGATDALGVTPLTPATFLAARMVAFSVPTVVVGATIALLARSAADIHVAGLLLTLTAMALFFVPLGVALAARIRTLDRFVIGGGLLSAGLGIVLLPFLGVADSPVWWILPSYGVARALGAALGVWGAPDTLANVLLIAIVAGWTALAFATAKRTLAQRAFGMDLGG